MNLPLALTLWHTFSRGRRERHTWRSFVDTFVKEPEIVRHKKQVAGFSLGEFEGDKRALPNVERIHGLVLDLDHGNPTVNAIANVFKKTLSVIYTTWSHEPGAPRLRAVFPHSRPVDAAEHDRIWSWAQQKCAEAELEIDPAARDASRLFFLPSHRPKAEYKFIELKGAPLDVERVLREARAMPPPSRAVPCSPSNTAGNITGDVLAALDQSPSGLDFRFCLDRLRAGDSDEELVEALRDFSKKARMRDDYVERTIERAREVHDAHAPRMKVLRASFRSLPARFAHPERRHIELELISEDGELARTSIVVPSLSYPNAATLWASCFPDIPPESLLAPWGEVASTWNQIRWRDRFFEVAVRDEAVRWMRASPVK